MAQRKRRRSSKKRGNDSYPGWVWMLFGLAIGLSVAFAVYVKDREPVAAVQRQAPEPASLQTSIDDNGETAAATEAPPEKRFDFYDMLPAFEIETEDIGEPANASVEPQAIQEPGVYILQAGSFSTHKDADRRRAELALHGVESYVQRARVNDREYHRVYVGPIEDLDELNVTRSRLRAAKIDVMRIRIGD